ncbi:MAG: GAF domain-containing protein, partial [Anaerolineae bacterium]|nr:GAF domain-containing protein [Anaerolineae bacterium]
FDHVDRQVLELAAQHLSALISSTRLVEEKEHRLQELAALNEIGQTIGSTLDLIQVLKLVAQKTAQVCGVERCSIMLLDDRKETLIPMMSQFASGAIDAELWRQFKEKSLSKRVDHLPIIAAVVRRGKAIVLTGESVFQLPKVWTERFGVSSALLVPLASREEIIGLMALDYSQTDQQFTARQVQLATTIGSQVAMAIQNARLYVRQERRAVQLDVINQVGRRATSSLDLDELLQDTVVAVQEAFRYHFVSILVTNQETGEMVQRAEVGLAKYMEMPGYRQSIDEGLIGWAVREGDPVLVNEVSRDARYVEGFPKKPFTKSELVVPIKVDSQVVAALDIQSAESNAFDRADLMSMQAIADQLSVSMRNASLYEESRRNLANLEAANRQLIALQQTGASLAGSLDLQQVLQGVVDGVVQGLGFSAAAIGVVNPTELVLENIVASGLTTVQLQEIERIAGRQLPGLRLPLGSAYGVVATALAEQQVVVTDSLYQLFRSTLDETLSAVAQELLGLKTIVAVPLAPEGGPLGVLCAATERSEIGDEELVSLRALANQAGLAVENAQLYQRTIARLNELSALHQISMAVTSTLNLQQILDHIVEALRDMLRLSNVAIMLIDDKDQKLKIAAGISYPPHIVDATQPGLGEGITGWVAMTGEAVNVPDVTADPRYLMADETVLSEACVPLSVGNKIIGVLNMESRQPAAFSEDTVRFMSTLAGQLAVTIQNARLFQKVAQGEKDWEDTFRAITDGIAIYGEDLTILRVNPSLADILGISIQSLVGRHCFEVYSYCYGADNPNCPHRRAARTKEPISVEVEEPNLGKTLQMVSLPIFDQDGTSKGMVHTVRDVTEEKALRAHLLQTEKLAAIGQLVSGVAHELNNPLTSVMGYSQLLLASDVAPEIKEDLRTIHHEAQRSAKIIDNLLTFARKETAQKRYCDINQILRDTMELRSYQLKVDNVQLAGELDEGLPWTMAAPHQLQQVFLNLINNAHQALMESDRARRLRVRSATVGGAIQVTVTDNGPGIPEEHLGKIFDPFFTTKEVGEGTGLGLSIAFGIVQDHGGTIRAESTPERGTIFTVELPVVDYAEDLNVPPSAHEDDNHHTGRRLLIIDDEEAILEVVARILERMGHHAVALTSADKAMEELAKAPYDLIICDVEMPGIGGRGLHRKVREGYPHLAGRIVFTTGDTISAATRAFLQDAGAPYLSKPFMIEELQHTIEKVLDTNPHPPPQ